MGAQLPAETVHWCESFESDVFQESEGALLPGVSWSRSSQSIASGDGLLTIPSNGQLNSRANASLGSSAPFVVTAMERLVSGGNNYLLPYLTLTFEAGNLTATYLSDFGWYFGPWEPQTGYVGSTTGGPVGEGSWMELRIVREGDSATLSARPVGDEDWTPIATADTAGHGRLLGLSVESPWNAHVEVDRLSLLPHVPGMPAAGHPTCE